MSEDDENDTYFCYFFKVNLIYKDTFYNFITAMWVRMIIIGLLVLQISYNFSTGIGEDGNNCRSVIILKIMSVNKEIVNFNILYIIYFIKCQILIVNSKMLSK